VPRSALSGDAIAAVYRAGFGDLDRFYAVSGVSMERGGSGC
jgi:hypothetical protein